MFKNKKKETKVEKAFNIPPQERNIDGPIFAPGKGRGAQIWNLSDIINLHARNKQGEYQLAPSDNPLFILDPEERHRMFQLSSPVFGVITSRMNRIAGLDFEIIPDTKDLEEKEVSFKNAYDIIKEYESLVDLQHVVTRAKLRQYLLREIPTLRADLQNFRQALLRWKKRIMREKQKEANEVKEWLLRPNPMQNWTDFIKIWVYDLMVHGTSAIYKKMIDGKLNNIQHLTGGSTVPIRTPYVDSQEAYIQVMNYDYQVYYEDEVVYSQYLPTSVRSYGMIPLEALINKITETMFFDRLMANQADGTKPPEKAAIITSQQAFGDDPDFNLDVGMNKDEQKRVEEKMNQPIKNGIITFSGNHVEIVDISKENTMEFQHKRQKDIREEVALVYNMSNIEVNLTGSADTSGRSTSEIQKEIEQGKGVAPTLKTIEQKINDEIIPYRKKGFSFKFSIEDSELKQIEILTKKVKSALYTPNELRIDELNKMPFDGEEYDRPAPTKNGFVEDNDETTPFYISDIGD